MPGTSAMLCNVLMPSTEVLRAKSTLFLLPSPVAKVGIHIRECQYCAYAGSNPSYVVYTIYGSWNFWSEKLSLSHSPARLGATPISFWYLPCKSGRTGGRLSRLNQRPMECHIRSSSFLARRIERRSLQCFVECPAPFRGQSSYAANFAF